MENYLLSAILIAIVYQIILKDLKFAAVYTPKYKYFVLRQLGRTSKYGTPYRDFVLFKIEEKN